VTTEGCSCPYCGEWIDVYVDLGGARKQDYIEDCSVCCRPIRMRITTNYETGESEIVANSDDE
jgi:hypothetical protein